MLAVRPTISHLSFSRAYCTCYMKRIPRVLHVWYETYSSRTKRATWNIFCAYYTCDMKHIPRVLHVSFETYSARTTRVTWNVFHAYFASDMKHIPRVLNNSISQMYVFLWLQINVYCVFVCVGVFLSFLRSVIVLVQVADICCYLDNCKCSLILLMWKDCFK